VSPDRLATLAPAVSPWVTPVLLFVDPSPQEVIQALQHLPNALLQFHGNESPETCMAFHRPFLKAVALRHSDDLIKSQARFAMAQGLLVDTPSQLHGGSGVAFDWSLIAPPDQRHLPLILAGGLSPGNVAAAVAQVRPYGVDVSSGVESARGLKDHALVQHFIHAVRVADTGSGVS
jgi:phosphoribosylanthranilate isomerase